MVYRGISTRSGSGLAPGPVDGNRGCVGLAKSVRFRLLKAGQRAFRNRQFGMEGGGKLHGGGEVLFGGGDAKGGLSKRRAAEHLGDHGAAAFHGGRRTGGVREDIDQPFGRKIERLADGEGLAERLPVNEERKIDRKLQR